jgi:hypothetical protein
MQFGRCPKSDDVEAKSCGQQAVIEGDSLGGSGDLVFGIPRVCVAAQRSIVFLSMTLFHWSFTAVIDDIVAIANLCTAGKTLSF